MICKNILVLVLFEWILLVSNLKLFFCVEVILYKFIVVIRVRIKVDFIDYFIVVIGFYIRCYCGWKWWSSVFWCCGGSGSCGWYWCGVGGVCGS